MDERKEGDREREKPYMGSVKTKKQFLIAGRITKSKLIVKLK